ncbi:MAG: hypothetical protein KDD33_08380 [Bdellovibrionales bacterium]|nr:hypothetical protein [Bdellovibrionales bacterium]
MLKPSDPKVVATIILDSKDYFFEVVDQAFAERKVDTYPFVKSYVVEILKHYLVTENLYDSEDDQGRKTRKTLAELYLESSDQQPSIKVEMLKRLGDSSLYISGFFSDSLQRKLIDVDYYVDMGKLAYESLAHSVNEDTISKLYREISIKFLILVDALSLISKRAKIMDEENVLRMMDLYAKTGSPLLQETLVEKGVFSPEIKKQSKQ